MAQPLDHNERLIQIQSSLGKALWQIQAFEDTLAYLIALVLRIPPRVSLEEVEAIIDNVRSGTLGKLLKDMKKAISFDDTFETFMSKILEERNWLVHRSWRTHGDFLAQEQEFVDLRYRLSRLTADAKEFNEFFVGIIESWARARGVTETEIESLSKEFADVWRQA